MPGHRVADGCRYLTQGLLQLFWPRICWVCQELRPFDDHAVCARCAEALLLDPHATCPRCSSTIGPFTDVSQGCPACRAISLAFNGAMRLGPYDGVLRDVILRMKHRRGERLAEVVGALWAGQLAPRVRPLAADVVVPIPLHWLRHWQRGFNQSEVLARCLAHELGIPCVPGCLRRIRRTDQQSAQLTPAARWENIKGAFAARSGVDLAGKAILLVDDVLTTGATASEAARMLRRFKPRSISVVVIAHDRR